jgi:phosphate-selective porin OprO/OprP
MEGGSQQTRANREIKLLSFLLFALWVLISLHGTAYAENEEEAKDTDQTDQTEQERIWIPKFAFPPSETASKAGYLPLWKRDFSMDYLKYTLYLSRERGLELNKKGSDFYFRMGGRIYLDFVHYYEDLNDLGPDGFGLRAIQIDTGGRFSEKWLYKLNIGGLANGGKYDGSQAYLSDAYVSYVTEENAWIFGQQKEPFSLEHLTSSLATTFMERGLPYALSPGRTIGVSYHTTRKQWSLSGGLFGTDIASSKDGFIQGIGFTGRFVFQPMKDEDHLTHFGGSISYRGISSNRDISYRYRPESGLTNVRYVNTGDISGVSRLLTLGLEAALVNGPLSFQAEYIMAAANRNGGYDNLRFRGWYAYVSWFLTGESRTYFPEEAIFGYPQIKSKWGAVELAARYSMVDLNSGSVPGGLERDVTLGVNWYINPKFRVMAEYLFVFCGQNANNDGTVLGGDRPQIFQMRFQFRL